MVGILKTGLKFLRFILQRSRDTGLHVAVVKVSMRLSVNKKRSDVQMKGKYVSCLNVKCARNFVKRRR
jgi:hypothetical protein